MDNKWMLPEEAKSKLESDDWIWFTRLGVSHMIIYKFQKFHDGSFRLQFPGTEKFHPFYELEDGRYQKIERPERPV